MTPHLAAKITIKWELARRNGYTQPLNLTLTIPELQELAALAASAVHQVKK